MNEREELRIDELEEVRGDIRELVAKLDRIIAARKPADD